VNEMSWSPGPLELLVILAIVILIFGGKRLKDVARGAGEAVKEFKEASSGQPKTKDEEEAIIEAAKKMGIETQGKSVQQILDEMNKKVSEKK